MNQRIINTLLIIAIVVLGGWAVAVLLQPQANIDVQVSPSAAHVTYDGAHPLGGTTRLTPGQHTIAAEFDGFAKVSQTVSVPNNGSVKLALVLQPNSSVGEQYLSDHPDEQADREALGGAEYTNSVQRLHAAYPILGLLPHSGRGFSVDYGTSRQHPKDPNAIALYITVPTLGQEARALNWITYSGYNPADYEIIYQYQDARD
jgi:hypothetical protein